MCVTAKVRCWSITDIQILFFLMSPPAWALILGRIKGHFDDHMT